MNRAQYEVSQGLALMGVLSPSAFLVPSTELSSAWVEHTPFAQWLAEAVQPRTFVELGTLHGVSYFTFCESFQRVGCGTRCFAVDTWEGDEHTGFYGDDVWRHVTQLNHRRFSAFSTLLRCTFDQALGEFEDGSIDLLHIDGRHFYEDVKHDFESWVPKLSQSAVVLFHDTNVHERGFGVARLWRELRARYPAFEFDHGNGLGVLAVGPQVPAGLRDLFEASKVASQSAAIRHAYARLGASVSERLSLRHEESMIVRLRSDIELVQQGGAAAANEAAQLREKLAEAEENQRLVQERAQEQIRSFEQLWSQKMARLNEIESLHREIERREAALQRLETEGAQHAREIASLAAQRDALLASSSWRVTAPLRWASRHAALPTRLAKRVARALKRGDLVLQVRRAVQDIRAYRDLRTSPLFDRQRYVAVYPDVAGRNALWHYVRSGAREGRQPNDMFDSRWYLETYPDVRASGANPLWHYVRSGAREGRDPGPGFDSDWYLSAYQDVANSGANPLVHYLASGRAEGRHAVPPRVEGLEDEPVRPAGSAPAFDFQPLISIVTPVYNVAGKWLRRAVESVQAQTYANWELCLCDDGSTNPETLQAMDELAAADRRIRVSRMAANGGISAATNKAIEAAQGEFLGFLDNDDELTFDALETCVAALNADRSIDVLYSDEDKLDFSGRREEPFFKPDWSPSLLREVMYVGHFLVARKTLVRDAGGLDSTYDGVQDFEFMLRLSEHTANIHHISKILYHWRRIPGSVADHSDAKPGLGLKQVAAVNAHLKRLRIAAEAVPHPKLAHRAVIRPLARTHFPKVSIVIPTKDAGELISRCLDSIFSKTTYPAFEVVVVDNGTTDPVALGAMDRHTIVRVPFCEQFNFSRANNVGVAAASGEILVLLNNDTEVVHADWLDQLLFLLEQPDVGAVGPVLFYPDGTIQHAGVAIGMRGTADHVLRGLPANADGYFGSLACTREVSAVTFACAMLRKADYLAVGGLEELYRTHYQDVDLCLRLIARGRKIICTPRTHLVHYESATRGTRYDHLDRALFIDSWAQTLAQGDRYSRWEPEARKVAKAA